MTKGNTAQEEAAAEFLATEHMAGQFSLALTELGKGSTQKIVRLRLRGASRRPFIGTVKSMSTSHIRDICLQRSYEGRWRSA